MSTHRLSFETPTTRDYLSGGFGDLIAQCSCGTFEFVYSNREGSYWHALHVAQPQMHAQFLLVNAPMPEGWAPPARTGESTADPRIPARRAYACSTCVGVGSMPAFGAQGGRFYHFGDRAVCAACDGSGVTDKWAAA